MEQSDNSSKCDFNSKDLYNGKGVNATVYFDPNADPDIMTVDPITGNVSGAKRPNYIGLAHEMIHADRAMRGAAIKLKKTASKREQKAYHATCRGNWGDVNPVTRKSPDPKVYNRKKSGRRYEHEPLPDFYFESSVKHTQPNTRRLA